MGFIKAQKAQAKARLGLLGPPGSGKTYSALGIASGMAPNGRIAVIDTENASASKYADKFSFDVLVLTDFSPQKYIDAIKEAECAGYDVCIVDSLSHAWMGSGGILQIVDNVTARSRSGNAFATGWREATPLHNQLIESIVQCKCHIIVTMRTKVEWVVEDAGNGKKAPRKVGMAPVQREGMEYEFDIVGDVDDQHRWLVTKTRYSPFDNKIIEKPGESIGQEIAAWLSDGVAPPPPPQIALATPDQISTINRLVRETGITPETVDKWFKHAGVSTWGEMRADHAAKCIGFMNDKLPKAGTPMAANEGYRGEEFEKDIDNTIEAGFPEQH